ncbi:glycosyl hydrolase family 95 catalytic domain-containing protein [Thermoflexus sp.]|uniref:glycosyl hydrolase family 95 catalytic domain-containing protein n=1 Tax=Thermoflexus sp. TaxID=1969742 RepID=UPI0017737323|nr:hypothetical protein [Thermoflexus sp.]
MRLPRDYYHAFLGNGHDGVLIGYTGAMVPDRPPNGWHPYLDRCQWYKSDRYYPEDRLVDVVPPRHPPFAAALPKTGKPWAELAPLGYTAYEVEVEGQAGQVHGFTQTFIPEEGTVYTTVDWGVARAEVTTFLCPDRPLLVIRYRFNRPVRLRVRAAPGVWQEEGHETDPFDALTFLNGRPAAFYRLGPYQGFIEVALAEAQCGGREGKVWWLEGEGTAFTHYFAIVDDYAGPLDTEIIPRAMAEGPEALHARTRAFWRDYFAASRFELPDPAFERVYRTSRYLFKAIQNPISGGLPVGNLRLTWSSHLFWDAYFIHRALLEANHIAEGEAAIRFFLRTREAAERHAREDFNAPGLKWDWELTHRGEPAYGIWVHQKEQVHNNAAYANMLFQLYAFTRDRRLLERVFPLLEGLAVFFLHAVVEETPRGFEIRPMVGVDERPVRVRNEGITLAGTIRLLERYVQAARLLGRADGLIERSAQAATGLRRTLGRLYNGRYFQASEEEDHLNMSSLAPIYPMEVIPPEDPRAIRTVRAYRERYAGRMVGHGNNEWGFPWAAAVLATIQAWQGDGEGAWQTLQEIRPAFSMHGGIAETVDDEGRWNMQYFGTAHGALCTALHHLVVQTREDGIRIATSLPATWERGAWENWRAHGLLLSGEWDRRRNHLEASLRNPTGEPIAIQLRIGRMDGELTVAPGEARRIQTSLF